MTLSGPKIEWEIEVFETGDIDSAVKTLKDKDGPDVTLGYFKRGSVVLARDEEFDDRCFLTMQDYGRGILRITLDADDIASLAEALEDPTETKLT